MSGPEQMANLMLLPPLTLAYLGDAIFELYVRRRLLELGRTRVRELHRGAVEYVRASAQAETLAAISSSLSDEERDIVRRGRNAKGHAGPKGADPAEYNAATAFEALLGYLYLAGREERLGEVLDMAARMVEQTRTGRPEE